VDPIDAKAEGEGCRKMALDWPVRASERIWAQRVIAPVPTPFLSLYFIADDELDGLHDHTDISQQVAPINKQLFSLSLSLVPLCDQLVTN